MGQLYQERKTPGNETLPILSVSIHTGVSDGSLDEDELGKRVKRSEDKSLYKQALTGDLVFNMMRAWQGAIGVVKTPGMVSPAYIVAEPNEGVYPPFMDFLFSTPQMINRIHRLSYGVTDFRLRLYWDSFVSIDCRIPQVDEQMKIAQFLSKIEQKIDAQQRLINALKSYKRGVSNAIFAHSVGFHHEGETETFTWCVMPFGEVFDFLNSNTLSRADLNYFGGEVKNIHYGDILTKYGAITDPSSSTVPYINIDAPLSYLKLDYLKTGDIVIADTAEDLTAGKVTEIACSNEAKCVSGLHTVACRPRQRFASGYLGHYLNSAYYHRQLLPLIQGTKVSSIARSALAGTQIAFPCLSDQIKVSKCLSLIDTRVESEERKLERLVECKKSLLQKLFV